MEVSLSFDNAVVNASVLKTWDEFWQKLFLGVGIIIAVFGMRLLFPLVIVAVAADLGMGDVWNGAENPKEYSMHLTNHHAEVAAFGGMFLLLVFLNFLFDDEKEHHWLGNFEEEARFARQGVLDLGDDRDRRADGQHVAGGGRPEDGGADVRPVGHPDLRRRRHAVELLEKSEEGGGDVGDMVKRGGIGGFLYLEVLDASFSFDGVIGAFAITNDVVIIMLGLAIGAMFVRSMTVYLVEKGTLDEFVYLEHGAHYAIGILALIMLASMKFHVPEW
jgi:hypothetical protein